MNDVSGHQPPERYECPHCQRRVTVETLHGYRCSYCLELWDWLPGVCATCCVEAPLTEPVFFKFRSLVWSSFVVGNLCTNCLKKYFRRYTLLNLFLGWTVLYDETGIVQNIREYAKGKGVLPLPSMAVMPSIDEEVSRRMAPFRDELLRRLERADLREVIDEYLQKPAFHVAAFFSTCEERQRRSLVGSQARERTHTRFLPIRAASQPTRPLLTPGTS
jgi:hypothetical protein